MKKLSYLILTLFYVLLTVGFQFNVHYCGGEVSDIALYSNDAHCCCDSSPAKAISNKLNGCCEDLSQSVQLETDHFGTSYPNLNLVAEWESLTFDFGCQTYFENKTTNDLAKWDPPPKESLHLLNSSFLFYG